jgi:hypothetical protein
MLFRRISVLAAAFVLPATAGDFLTKAPNIEAIPANQLAVSGNACGPTALLNAFRFADSSWQRALVNIPGETDKQRILTFIREIGMRPSRHIAGRPRWSRKGVNIADLCDMANEATRGQMLPEISHEVLFLEKRETQERFLRRVHKRLQVSLSKRLPPVVSLRRYVLRGNPAEWVVLDAHFVTLVALPTKLEKNAVSFPVTYVDPWGGKICGGNITVARTAVLAGSAAASPCLEADFPQASVGKKLAKTGEKSVLTISAALGRW